jgi:hypothetical protein
MKQINVKTILTAVLLLIVLGSLLKDCVSPTPTETGTTIKVDTVYQEVKTETKVYVPKWRTRVETVEVPYQVTTPIDTTEVLKDYFARYVTIDTVRLPYPDSVGKFFGTAIIQDTITKNTIVARSIKWNYKIPIITKTITIHPQPRAQVYVGAMANVNSVQILSAVSGALLYKTKSDKIYIANIGVANNGAGTQPFLGAGILWKISVKKPKPSDLINLTK